MGAVDPIGQVGRPNGRVDCTGEWNEYIYNFCGNCYRNKPYNDYCRRSCDTLARLYYGRCGKGSPGPGIFRPPGKGAGTVAPRLPKFDPGTTSPHAQMAPFTFIYGNCCGLANRCNACDAEPGGKALDCLDEVCARHDECLGTVTQYVVSQVDCDAIMCKELENCSCDPYIGFERNRCEDAKWNMMTFYCPIGDLGRTWTLLPLTGGPIMPPRIGW